MAFDKDKLENDLKKVLKDMKEAKEKAKDSDLAEGIAKAVKDFGESGDITTTDLGKISLGTVKTASGEGSISLEASLCSAPILSACQAMTTLPDDITLATGIGTGIQSMTTAGVVTTSVSGTATNEASGVETPFTEVEAKGTISCQNATMIASLKVCFSDMNARKDEKGFNGDDYLAKTLANEVYAYYKAGIVNTASTGAMAGLKGTGTIQ